MAFSPGIFSHGFAVKTHYRLFLISWGNAIRCCGEGRRDYSSSFPVNYIPEKSSENEGKGAASLPLKYTEERGNGPGRVDFQKNLSMRFLHASPANRGDISYGLNMAVEDEVEGDSMTAEDNSRGCSGIQPGHSRQAVEKLAIELLASRAFTAVELKKKLLAKKIPLNIVETVITDFQGRGLINDCLYAETYSRSRWSSSSWGPRRIRQCPFCDASSVVLGKEDGPWPLQVYRRRRGRAQAD